MKPFIDAASFHNITTHSDISPIGSRSSGKGSGSGVGDDTTPEPLPGQGGEGIIQVFDIEIPFASIIDASVNAINKITEAVDNGIGQMLNDGAFTLTTPSILSKPNLLNTPYNRLNKNNYGNI